MPHGQWQAARGINKRPRVERSDEECKDLQTLVTLSLPAAGPVAGRVTAYCDRHRPASERVLLQVIQEAISLIQQIQNEHSPVGFACSFGLEDMVLLDMIAAHARRIEVFTLDTGRLPNETHDLLERVRDKYPVAIRVYCPDARQVEEWVEQNGPNGFYKSIAQRKQCCHIRKVLPLGRALAGKRAWITGLRREQSAARQAMQLQEWDAANNLQKFNPLLEWTLDDVRNYIAERQVPYNALHDQGYPSIGCAPCTRAVAPGEDIRAGR
jgi:phosphoadenosine phosphosulfate reductase